MANSSIGLLEALSQQSTGLGVNDWYQPAPYELPLMANQSGAFRIPPGSEYSPSRKRWETPEGTQVRCSCANYRQLEVACRSDVSRADVPGRCRVTMRNNKG